MEENVSMASSDESRMSFPGPCVQHQVTSLNFTDNTQIVGMDPTTLLSTAGSSSSSSLGSPEHQETFVELIKGEQTVAGPASVMSMAGNLSSSSLESVRHQQISMEHTSSGQPVVASPAAGSSSGSWLGSVQWQQASLLCDNSLGLLTSVTLPLSPTAVASTPSGPPHSNLQIPNHNIVGGGSRSVHEKLDLLLQAVAELRRDVQQQLSNSRLIDQHQMRLTSWEFKDLGMPVNSEESMNALEEALQDKAKRLQLVTF